jgi:hypothetical protein
MAFRLTDHARQRMSMRGITDEQVDEVMSVPDSIEPNPTGNGLIYAKVLDSRGIFRMVECVVDDAVEPNAIVTVMVTNL